MQPTPWASGGARRKNSWTCGIAAYAIALAIPQVQEFFRLLPPDAQGVGCIALGLVLAAAGLAVAGIRPGRAARL